MIYFISDLHLGHDKLFMYGERGFSTIEEHNAAIVANWNRVVSDEDTVYLLGDVMLGDSAAGMEKFTQLKGEIHVIRGNHDTDDRMTLYSQRPRTHVHEGSIFFKYKKYRFLLSHYPTLTANFDDGKPLHARMINLCGHSHTTDRHADAAKGVIYHVDADAHNCTPVSIDEILADLRAWADTFNHN